MHNEQDLQSGMLADQGKMDSSVGEGGGRVFQEVVDNSAGSGFAVFNNRGAGSGA